MSDSLIILGILAVIGWLWWESRAVAEHATRVARQHCDAMQVNFLNDTVGWQKIRLKRNPLGQLQFERTYFFEFTTDMQQRYRGHVVMLGRRVRSIQLEPHRVG